MDIRNARGATGVEIVVIVAAVAAFGWLAKSLFFTDRHKDARDSRRATAALVATQESNSANAAASVLSIEEANRHAPNSPARNFIALEGPVARENLADPTPEMIRDAERRRIAVMEGQVAEAQRLYADVANRNVQLALERDQALAERDAVDERLAQAANLAARSRVEKILLGVVVLLVAAGWFVRARRSMDFNNLARTVVHAYKDHKAEQAHVHVETAPPHPGPVAPEPKPPAEPKAAPSSYRNLINELDSHLSPGQQKSVRKKVRRKLRDDEAEIE